MKRKLLVTGGAGFIGSNFIQYWMKNHPEDELINLDVLTYAGNLANLKSVENNPNYHFVKGDITDKNLVNEITKNIDILVHFAAESHVDRSILDPQIFLKTNILGTQVLLDACLKNKVPHFHHISTDEVFGSLSLKGTDKFTLETNYDPRSPYSASKASSDHLVRAYGETYGLAYTLTNCSNNYGPFQFPEKLFGLAITNLLEGKKIPVYGTGENIRDWLFVIDHCRAIETVLLNGKKNETYLIGGMKKDVTNFQVVQMIAKLMGEGQEVFEFVKDRAGHDLRYSVDWSKINQELGWSPSVSLEEGLMLTIDWYKKNSDWWKPLKQKAQGFFDKNYQKK